MMLLMTVDKGVSTIWCDDYLGGGGCGHGGQQQGITHAVSGDVGAQAIPVPAVAGGLDSPHVVLQHALAHRAAVVCLIGAWPAHSNDSKVE